MNPSLANISPDRSYVGDLYIPQDIKTAHWNLGGGFRFDSIIALMHDLYKNTFKTNSLVHEVNCVVSCLWSAETYGASALSDLTWIKKQITWYEQRQIAVFVLLDNLEIDEASLTDDWCNELCTYLSKPFWKCRHGVYVSQDILASYIKKKYPRLIVRAASTRHVDVEKRTVDYYESLLSLYDRVCLHPDDVFEPDIINHLNDKSRYEIVVNDRWKKQSSARKEFAHNRSLFRYQPYNGSLQSQKDKILKQEGMNLFSNGATCLLSMQRWQELMKLGYRNFSIQSTQLRSEISFVQHLLHWLFDRNPIYQNKKATLYSFLLVGAGAKPETDSPCAMMEYRFD